MNDSRPDSLLQLLDRADAIASRTRAVIGFDGFVDTILHVVDRRQSATRFTRLGRIAEFGGRITAAAGLSANFELVTAMVKLGGNGPIMAHALAGAGLGITYIGNLGCPDIHPVFADFARRVEVHSIAEPGYTDAVEFADGKLMLGKLQGLTDVNWASLTAALPVAKLTQLCAEARLIAIVNWTMVSHLGEIMEQLLAEIVPGLGGERRWVFFDLADPAKRTAEDIAAVLRLIGRFEGPFRAILGLNFNESRQIGRVLGLAEPPEEPAAVAAHAAAIRDRLGIGTVVIHPVSFAAAADGGGSCAVPGPFEPQPKITTGAGDHFNAGFCLGRLAGGGLRESLQVGVAASGFYVRTARSPSVADLRQFVPRLPMLSGPV